MRTFLFLSVFVFALLIACNQPTEPAATDPPATAQEAPTNESGEPLAATDQAVPTVQGGIVTYCSYHLVRGAGAITTTGAIRVESKAWLSTPAGQTYNPELFIRDLISALEKEGVLAGVDLTKTKANWLTVLWPGATPPASSTRKMILDSRDLPQKPRE